MMKYRILIVDDDRDSADMLAQFLEFNGHQVTTAPLADEELWFSDWQWQDFNCIVTDINMPGMNGLEFTRMVQDTGGPPVIVMSGYKPPSARVQAFEVGAAAFLEKPFKLEDLLKIVEICCKRGKSTQ